MTVTRISLNDLGIKYVYVRGRQVSLYLLKVVINTASIPEDNWFSHKS